MDFGLIGYPLGHSFSKEIHESLGLYAYEISDLPEENFAKFMTEKKFRGINVTIPYKQRVIPYLDEIDETAKEIGAVNTIVNRDGRLYGYNTDLFGISNLILKTAGDISEKTVLILGSGGTSRTAAYAAKTLGAKKIYKATRKPDLLPDGDFEFITYDNLDKIVDITDIIINTTPVGMFPDTDCSPVDISVFKNLSAVVDAIYNPLKTKLVYAAEGRNIPAQTGLYMLVSQAVKAAELFTGEKISEETLNKVFSDILRSKRNIVLTGMPGCGKTTVGKLLAEKTEKTFADTDELIEKEYGHPSKIIREHGEEYFRDIESRVISDLKNTNAKVIAVGGGAVLRKENVENLKKNGVTVFIDRDINDIQTTNDRPLSSDRSKLKKLYDTRYPIYAAAADITVVSDNNAENVTDMIIKEFSK